MGCRSDYMEPSSREIESKNVINLMNEVGLFSNATPYYGETEKLDEHTAMLCKFCQTHSVTEYSLELQIWWRDHKAADIARVKQVIESTKIAANRATLLDSLSDYEKSLLNLN